MGTNAWVRFINAHSGNDSNSAIAHKVGISASNITRWKSGNFKPEATSVISYASAYGINPISALAAAGYIDTDQLEDILVMPADLTEATTPDLLTELQRRLADLREIFTILGLKDDADGEQVADMVRALHYTHLPKTAEV